MATKKQMHPFYVVFSLLLYLFCLSPAYSKPQPDFCRYGHYESLPTHAMAESLKLYILQTPELLKKMEDEALDAYQCFGHFHWSDFDKARSDLGTYCTCAHPEPEKINQKINIDFAKHYSKQCTDMEQQADKIKAYDQQWTPGSKPESFNLNKFEWFCEDVEYFEPDISLESKDAHVDHLQGVLLTTAKFLADKNDLVLRGAGVHEYSRHWDVLEIAKKLSRDKTKTKDQKMKKKPVSTFNISNETLLISGYFGQDVRNAIKKAQDEGDNIYIYFSFISDNKEVVRNYIRITPVPNKKKPISKIDVYDRMLMSVISVPMNENGFNSLAGFYLNITQAMMTKTNTKENIDTVKVKIFPYPADPDLHKHSDEHIHEEI